jgi:hypothetical protein
MGSFGLMNIKKGVRLIGLGTVVAGVFFVLASIFSRHRKRAVFD